MGGRPAAGGWRKSPEGKMNVEPALADVEVKDVQGNPVRVGSLWADRPAVVIWVRHFG